jgi:hypothetical protein
MSDFFTRMAERILGSQPVVQPLIASFYAPGPILTPSAPLHAADEVASEEASSAGPTGKRSGQNLAATPGRDVRRPVGRNALRVEPPVAPGHELGRQATTDASLDVGAESMPPPASVSARPATREAEAPTRQAAPPAAISADADSTEALPARLPPATVAPGAPVERPLSPDVRARPRGAKAIPPLVPLHEPRRTAPPQRGTVGILTALRDPATDEEVPHTSRDSVRRVPRVSPPLQPRRARRAGGTSRAAAEQESQPAGPSIRVTIGRIEVRAVPTAEQLPQRAPRPAPKLSLDEYLKQERGGRR